MAGNFQSDYTRNERGRPGRDQQNYRGGQIAQVNRQLRQRGLRPPFRLPRNAGREQQKIYLRNAWRVVTRDAQRERAERQRQRRIEAREAEAARVAEEQRVAGEQQQAAVQDWGQRFWGSAERGMADARDYFTSRGVDWSQYAPQASRRVSQIAASMQPGQDFASAFGTLGQQIYDQAQNALRTSSMNQVNRYFTPELQNTLIADNAYDPAIEAILASQQEEAREAAERARDRNQLTETGFNAADAALQDQRTQGLSFLQDIGGTLLGDARAQIGGIGDQARARAQNIMLGDTFDIGGYQTQAQGVADRFLEGLEGRLSSQAGDVFNIGDALGKGNIVQGQQNLGQEKKPLAGIFTGQEEDEEEPSRQTPVNSIF